MDPADAKALTAPYICLASKDEPADKVAAYKEVLGQPGHVGGEVDTYTTMFHGWMGSRARLDDEEHRKEYERGYEQAAKFFDKYL